MQDAHVLVNSRTRRMIYLVCRGMLSFLRLAVANKRCLDLKPHPRAPHHDLHAARSRSSGERLSHLAAQEMGDPKQCQCCRRHDYSDYDTDWASSHIGGFVSNRQRMPTPRLRKCLDSTLFRLLTDPVPLTVFRLLAVRPVHLFSLFPLDVSTLCADGFGRLQESGDCSTM